jgi:TIR domain
MQENRSSEPVKIFYAYSHRDEKLRDKLEMHLSTLKHQHLITNWHDREIKAGREWENEIEAHLSAAQIVLLLVSSEFLALDCWCKIERSALELHELGKYLFQAIFSARVNTYLSQSHNPSLLLIHKSTNRLSPTLEHEQQFRAKGKNELLFRAFTIE